VKARIIQTKEYRKAHPTEALGDSIVQFSDFFHCGSPESFWRLFGFKVWDSNTTTDVLPVFLPNEEHVVWTDATSFAAQSGRKATLLDDYFNRNDYQRHLLYAQYHRNFLLGDQKPAKATSWISKDGKQWAHMR
jgi:hypothetical protein